MTVLKRFAVALDIKRPGASPNIEVVEGDNGNVFEVTLTDNGVAVDLSDCRVVAVFALPDGTTAQQDNNGHGITVDSTNKNEFDIELYTGSFLAGTVNCEIQIYSGTGQDTLATTAWFNFKCRTGIANEDTIPATNEWPILVDMMNRVDDAEAELAVLNDATTAAASAANAAATTANEAADNADETNGAIVTAEGLRVTAEGNRVTAEGLRVTAESGRSAAEGLRVTAESNRVTAEGNRVTAESSRASAETSRASAETSRSGAESSRVSAENARASRDTAFGVFEDYNALTAYVPLNKVYYNGSTYQCILASTGNLPTNTTYWKIVASKGADGEGSGDMLASVYDPTGVEGDAFDVDNHVSGTVNKVFTATEKTKLEGIAENANNYSHPTDAGNKHVPSGGASGDFLKYSADGTAAWSGDITELQNSETVITLSGSGPAFTTTDALPASGKKRTLKFPAAATSATVEFATGGAINVYAYGTTAFKPKANQVVEVVYDGSNFTVCSAGGGIELPATVAAGDLKIYSKSAAKAPTNTYAWVGTGYGFTAVKAGIYRVTFWAEGVTDTIDAKLQKNGVDVASSAVSTGYNAVMKSMDLSLNAGDQIKLWADCNGTGNVHEFSVAIVAADLQAALADYVTVL